MGEWDDVCGLATESPVKLGTRSRAHAQRRWPGCPCRPPVRHGAPTATERGVGERPIKLALTVGAWIGWLGWMASRRRGASDRTTWCVSLCSCVRGALAAWAQRHHLHGRRRTRCWHRVEGLLVRASERSALEPCRGDVSGGRSTGLIARVRSGGCGLMVVRPGVKCGQRTFQAEELWPNGSGRRRAGSSRSAGRTQPNRRRGP